MQYRNDRVMVKVLDANEYSDYQTITLKVPVAIPYMQDNTDFARVDGKFEYQGEHYRLIRQKYAEDTLTVVCIRDHENERITQALSNYVKTFSDKGSEHNKSSKLTLSLIKDFLPHTFALSTLTSGWQMEVIQHSLDNHLVPTFTASVVHPPERP